MIEINSFKAELTNAVMPDSISLPRQVLGRGHPELMCAYFLDYGSEAGMTDFSDFIIPANRDGIYEMKY